MLCVSISFFLPLSSSLGTLAIGYESALLGHCVNQDIFVKRRVGHSYPMTIRVTWDSSWKARLCVHPSLRSSCLISVV